MSKLKKSELKESDLSKHYQTKVQPIDTMRANMTSEAFIGYLRGNIIKYACRLGKKDRPLSEALKLQRYAEWLVDACGNLEDTHSELELSDLIKKVPPLANIAQQAPKHKLSDHVDCHECPYASEPRCGGHACPTYGDLERLKGGDVPQEGQ